MNWIQNLYETYENCQNMLGYSPDTARPLLPICHITTQTHIEIVIDGKGNFRRARIVDKDDSTTIIPATESSASRAGSKPECHPLSDKLQYLAGDFTDYGGEVTSGFADDPTEPYKKFVELLTNWCNSPYSHPKARAVLAYVQKKTLIRDLAAQKVLLVGDNGKLLGKEETTRDKKVKDIFSVLNAQDNAVIRWVVEISGDSEGRAWRDAALWESWTNYYLNSKGEKNVCLVTGQMQILTANHPKYIRREGDNAKLISSNDTSNFTFRGRFITDAQACGVGLETSQKAHYALAWLISRQGYQAGDLAVVAWATSGAKLIQPTDDPIDALDQDAPVEESKTADTAQEVGIRLKKKIAGYRQEIGEREDVAVIAVDSATPGRLSIVYYRALKGSEFLERIENWHETCAWRHTYHAIEVQDEKGKTKKRYIPFDGAPAPADIAEAAYGSRLDDKLKKATIKRLLPCIVDGQPIPRDLVESVIRRASNRAGLSGYDWSKALTIACALYRKYKYGKENFDMSLDETRNTRDYLFGRLLAIADVMEERTLSEAEKKRPTNATRYMQQFSQRPFTTWKQIHELLTPYFMRQGDNASYYKWLIAQVEDLFTPEDFISNKPLTGEYLLGYYCQRQKMWEKKEKPASEENDNADSNG
ncbi:MAG: type I-C CRISPR-associated protein Cas8c/Csd1 [Chloroflexi bacterium]|nr:type I-C CRISPR-associated protein Cas8c/Csd1 [Chloroflexota bacterium]